MNTKHPYEHAPAWYAKELHERAARHVEYPSGAYSGKGIVLVAGGQGYLSGAWASVNILRSLGLDTPIQLWYFGDEECDDRVRGLFASLGVECVDAKEILRAHPSKSLDRPRGASRFARFELKCYAIVHSRFEEVLFLDADNIPLRDVRPLFENPVYKKTGALFWPDPPYGARPLDARAWRACGMDMQPGPSFESGQLLLDKRRCWNQLRLCMWMNEESDYWFSLLYGDKDSYKVAWHVTNAMYGIAPAPRSTFSGILQHAPDGDVMFYHRWFKKPRLSDRTLGKSAAGHRAAQRAYAVALSKLRSAWNGRFWADATTQTMLAPGLYRMTSKRSSLGAILRADGSIVSRSLSVRTWHVGSVRGEKMLVIQDGDRVVAFLRPEDGDWIGNDVNGEPMALSPVPGGFFASLFVILFAAGTRCIEAVRSVTAQCVRAIEVVAVTVFGDALSGALRRLARGAVSFAKRETDAGTIVMKSPFRVSIVIPAHNEERYIRACVEACFSCDGGGRVREVVVVNNRSTDGTIDELRELQRRFGPRLVVVDEPGKGVAHARAAGFARTTGDFIAFVDADCRPNPAWLARMENAFVSHPEAVCASGPYTYYDLPPSYAWVFAAKEWYLRVLESMSVGTSQVCGGNFVARRSALVTSDPFASDIQVIGEDIETERRLRSVGKVVFLRALAIPSSCRRVLKEGLFYTFFMTRLNRYFQLRIGRPLRTREYAVWR